MKHILLSALILSGAAACPAAPANAREQAVKHIAADYIQSLTLDADSLYVSLFLGQMQALHPDISVEAWQALRPEFAQALRKPLFEDGLIEENIRATTSDLSDQDLTHLAKLMDDPVYVRFMRTWSTSAAQQELLRNVARRAPACLEALDAVLSRHGIPSPSAP